MTVGSSLTAYISLSSAGAGRHDSHFSQALIWAPWLLMMPGSSFTAHVSLSSSGAGYHCPPFSHALIGTL